VLAHVKCSRFYFAAHSALWAPYHLVSAIITSLVCCAKLFVISIWWINSRQKGLIFCLNQNRLRTSTILITHSLPLAAFIENSVLSACMFSDLIPRLSVPISSSSRISESPLSSPACLTVSKPSLVYLGKNRDLGRPTPNPHPFNSEMSATAELRIDTTSH